MHLIVLEEKLELMVFLMQSFLKSNVVVHHVFQLFLIQLLFLFLLFNDRRAFAEN